MTVALARGLGFDETAMGKVALVVTEAATNLVKHATRGSELLVRALECARVGGIEILALDKGPGIANVAEAMRDGYSTTGSPGTGLGAISRLAAFFDIHSVPGVGTALLARLWATSPPSPLLIGEGRGVRLEIGVVSLPKAGEESCGDAWAVEQKGLDKVSGFVKFVQFVATPNGTAQVLLLIQVATYADSWVTSIIAVRSSTRIAGTRNPQSTIRKPKSNAPAYRQSRHRHRRVIRHRPVHRVGSGARGGQGGAGCAARS